MIDLKRAAAMGDQWAMRNTLHILLWAGLVTFSALAGMMAHELGHVAAARMMGLAIAQVVWGPIATGELSRTMLVESPRPVTVVWAGFVVGCALPVAMWLVAAGLKWRRSVLLRFFAGFCLVGNGAYLAAGWVEPTADGGELARAGVAIWLMVVVGLMLVVSGLAAWHRLSAAMNQRRIGGTVVMGVWIMTGALCSVQWWLNG